MERYLTNNWLTLLVLMFLIGYVRADVTTQELGAGLSTLRVVVVDLPGKSVTYIPVKPTVIDLQGKPKNRFDVFPISNSSLLISGAIALQADKSELVALQQRAETTLGQGASIKQLQPDS